MQNYKKNLRYARKKIKKENIMRKEKRKRINVRTHTRENNKEKTWKSNKNG